MIGLFANSIRPKGYLTVTYHRRSPDPPPPTATEGADVIEQIRRLGELRDAGYLTAEEFNGKKAELLGRL